MQKRCSKCQEVKPATPEYFHKDSNRKDRLNPRCKVCVKAYQQSIHPKMIEAAYRWRDANPEKQRDAMNSWRERNPESIYASSRAYYLAHQEENRQHKRNWRAANPDKSRKASLQWAKDNPIKNSIKDHRRRARKMDNGGSYTADEWEALCKQYDYRCLCCKEQKPLTVDHVIPISKGGSNDISNIQPLCKPCNSKKYLKTTDYR